MYLFAGFTDTHFNSNSLYKLNLETNRWDRADTIRHSDDYSDEDTDDEDNHPLLREKSAYVKVPPDSMPSRRDKLCGWTYENRLYFFGGFGPRIDSDTSYLKEDGNWVADHSVASQVLRGWNNQVICFDLDTKRWSSVPTTGPRPLPRAAMCCALLGDRVYIFGGRHEGTRRADMVCLDMKTFKWTGELVPPPDSERPSGRSWSAMSVVDRHRLFLFGGYDQNSTPLHDSFFFDVRDNRWTPLPADSLPDLGALPIPPMNAFMETRPRNPPGTTKGLFWHTMVTLTCPPTAAANPGIYAFGGMLTPINQTAHMTYHSSHLLHFAFKPKSLTLLALEHLAQSLTLVESASPADEAPATKAVDYGRALEWLEECLPRPLPAVLRSRVYALLSIRRMEFDHAKRPNQLPGLPQRPTDGAGGNLEDIEVSSDDDLDYHDAHPQDVESDQDSYDSEDGYEVEDQ